MFEEDHDAEEGEIGERVIVSGTGEELGVVKTIGTRPKGQKPPAEEFGEWGEDDEDDILIQQFLES